MKELRLTVGEGDASLRLDKFISLYTEGFSRERLKELFVSEEVLLNGKPSKPSQRVNAGDEVRLTLPDIDEYKVAAENIPINIVYEDDDVAVVDKPQGMVVHPACGNYSGTLTNALMFHLDNLSAINGALRPGIVHRIDKDTSGLLVVAKNDLAHNALAEQFKKHSITRAYKAIVHGTVPNKLGIINAPIGRSYTNRKMMAVTEKNNKTAVTHYQTLAANDKYSYMKLVLETGRTHQIRVHMKYINHPVVGDRLYGYNNKDDLMFEGQLLHAYLLGFEHPRSGKYVEFTSPIPEYFNKVFNTSIYEGDING